MTPSKSKSQKYFWITNISRKVVGLSDLGVYLKPLTSINLLDSRHYYFTEEQLIKSATSGSIFAKRNMISIRKIPPGTRKKDIILVEENALIPTKKRSTVVPNNVKYEELEITDDDFAAENADTAEHDHIGKWNNSK